MRKRSRSGRYQVRWVPPSYYRPAKPYLQCDAEGNPEIIVCSDMTRRAADRTGTEGGLQEACDQVKVSLVPVVEPYEVVRFRRLAARFDRDALAKHLETKPDIAFDYDLALLQIDRILFGGETLKAEWAPKTVVAEDGTVTEENVYAYHEIDAAGATKRYGVHDQDICPKIPGA